MTATPARLARSSDSASDGLSIGTSGWSYPSWRPGFYPAGLANEDFLGFYAERFDTVELNTTGYRLPSEEQFARWAAQAPPGFTFAPKLPQRSLRSLGTFEERVRRLGERLGPVRVVVESPRDDGLLALLLGSTDLRLALDLRDPSWDGVDVRPAVRVGDWEAEAPFRYLRFREPPIATPIWTRSPPGSCRCWTPARTSLRTSGTRTSPRHPPTRRLCWDASARPRPIPARLPALSRARTCGVQHLSYRS